MDFSLPNPKQSSSYNMFIKPTFLRAVLLQTSAVCASTQPYHSVYARHQDLQWGPCTLSSSLPIECANITVPLDYSSPNSTELLTFELLKAPAVNKPSKGSLLMNFGGPGFPGRVSLAGGAEKLQIITGGYHALITFDPR